MNTIGKGSKKMGQESVPKSSRGKSEPNYRLRRIVVAGVALSLLALIVWGVFLLVSALTSHDAGLRGDMQSDQSQSHSQVLLGVDIEPGEEVTADGIIDNAGAIRIPQCRAQDLLVSAEPQNTGVGVGANLKVSVENRGSVACQMNAGALSVRVRSGDELYFNSQACGDFDADSHPLLLRPHTAWSGEIAWNGRTYNECTPVDTDADGQADVASEGTYTLDITMNTMTLTTAVVTLQ